MYIQGGGRPAGPLFSLAVADRRLDARGRCTVTPSIDPLALRPPHARGCRPGRPALPAPGEIIRNYTSELASARKVFNFGIAKISATTEITEFREIRPKFRQNYFRD